LRKAESRAVNLLGPANVSLGGVTTMGLIVDIIMSPKEPRKANFGDCRRRFAVDNDVIFAGVNEPSTLKRAFDYVDVS